MIVTDTENNHRKVVLLLRSSIKLPYLDRWGFLTSQFFVFFLEPHIMRILSLEPFSRLLTMPPVALLCPAGHAFMLTRFHSRPLKM